VAGVESWLEIVLRQIILYSLPMLVSLGVVGMLEARLSGKRIPHAFYAMSWKGAWLPWLACIALNRAVIFSLPRAVSHGARAAAYRFVAHALLCALGFILYTWSLSHPAVMGLPPLHHWWAKVLMFFNLCMLGMHLLPLPGMWFGEYVLPRLAGRGLRSAQWLLTAGEDKIIWVWVGLAASPLPDAILGAYGIFPIYGELATWAAGMAR